MRRALIAILGVCAGVAVGEAAAQQAPAADETDARLTRAETGSAARTLIWGEAADLQLSNQQRLVGALERFGIAREDDESLRAWIGRIIRESDVLSGLGGPSAQLFLRAAEKATSPAAEGGRYAGPVHYTTTGELVPGEYAYDEDDNSGRLQVIMTTMRHVPRPGGQPIPAEAYRWTIRVKPGGFSVHTKNLDDPDDVFPNTPLAITAQAAAGFYYKLLAEGDDIVIESIEKRSGRGNWRRLRPNHPFYAVSSSSCIDMMFPGEPPARLADDAAPPLYCLGRCTSPPIVNTK